MMGPNLTEFLGAPECLCYDTAQACKTGGNVLEVMNLPIKISLEGQIPFFAI